MLEAKVNGCEIERLYMRGSTEDLVTDLGTLITAAYNALECDPVAAGLFRRAITSLVGAPSSPLWDVKPSQAVGFTAINHVRRKDGETE